MSFSYWPGGIPDSVKFDESPIPYDDLEILTNGWRHFIKTWVPVTGQDPTYNAGNRRALLLSWARAPQSLRDHHQKLGESNPAKWNYKELRPYITKKEIASVDWYTCIAPLNTSRNRELWTKLRILSYDFDNGDMMQGITNPSTLSPSPFSSSSILEPKDFMKTWAVENADFSNMAMTLHGTVVFQGRTEWILADQQSLETGLLLWVNIESNGSVRLKLRITVLELNNMYNHYFGLGRGVEAMRHSYGYDGANQDVDEPVEGVALDMTRPILGLFEDIAAGPGYADGLLGLGEKWRSMIERIALGYLLLEEEGKAEEYEHSKFKRI